MPAVEENHQLVMPELGECSKETGALPQSLDQQVIELSPTPKGQNFLKNSEVAQMEHMGLPDTAGVFLYEIPHSCAKEVETQVCLRNFLAGAILKKDWA